MKCRVVTFGLSAAICTALIACTPASQETAAPVAGADPAPAPASSMPAAPESRPAAPTDLEQLAQRLVTQSAAVKQGDIVFISGQPHDAELMENIAVHVAKVGGFPMVGYSSDRLAKRMFFDVPEQYDAQTDALGMKLAEVVDVNISIGNGMTQDLFAGADPKRMAARGKANVAIGQAFLKNNVRTVDVGNNLYPTAWRAERFGMAEDELSKTFWNGVNIDYAELQTRGEQVKAALSAGNEMHITNPNGTDLKLRVQGRPVLVSDGIISPADMKLGGASMAAYLPAGEVYTTPVAGTAEGKVVHSRDFYRGKQIDNLTMTFAGGKMTEMTGTGPGFADFKAEYDAVSDPRKDLFGYVDLGINPNVKLAADSKVGNWVPAGTVTVGTGTNTWAGGDNSVPYGATIYLPGSTVMLDGKAIVENGVLKL